MLDIKIDKKDQNNLFVSATAKVSERVVEAHDIWILDETGAMVLMASNLEIANFSAATIIATYPWALSWLDGGVQYVLGRYGRIYVERPGDMIWIDNPEYGPYYGFVEYAIFDVENNAMLARKRVEFSVEEGELYI